MVATGKQKHDRTSCKSVAVQQLGIGELAELPICRVTIVHPMGVKEHAIRQIPLHLVSTALELGLTPI